MIRRISFALLVCTIGWFAPAASAREKEKTKKEAPTGDKETLSKAITPEIVSALKEEIARSMKAMRLDDAESPYFISYKVTEVEVNDAVASLGALTAERERHFVILEAHVHVGDYKFDNSNFVFSRREGVDGIAQIPLPLEATPALARRSAWLVTDAAYKEALEQFHAKREALTSGASGGLSDTASYTKQAPVVSLDPVLVPVLEPGKRMRERAETLSKAFEKEAHVRDSRVAFTSFLERRWLLNSEGNAVHDTRRVSGIGVVVTGQADDGQELARYFTSYGRTEADLPDDEALKKQAERLSKELAQLIKAPLVDAYTGPVLFQGEGAAGVIRETLGRHLSGTPLPVGLSDSDATRFGGELVGRINLPVVSEKLSFVDDPTESRWKNTFLIGAYRFDDEGTAAERVEVIKNGRLKQLLMSRTPSKGLDRSNGHARLAMPGGIFRGSPTNLFVTGRGGVARNALVKKLVASARAAGLPYGVLIRQFDDPALTANPDLSRFRMFQLLSSIDRTAPPMAVAAYRVYPNGREELVRGVQLKAVDLRAWREIIGVSKELTAVNFLSSTDDPWLMRLQGGGEGFVPSSGIESAIVTPDLLFEQLDIKPSAAGRRPPPTIPAPRN
jgi:hypothetical protein